MTAVELGASSVVEEPDPHDGLFYRKAKGGGYAVIDAPMVPRFPIADAHTHLQSLSDPVMALARAGSQMAGLLCTVVDVAEDGDATFRELDGWKSKAIGVLRRIPGPNAC